MADKKEKPEKSRDILVRDVPDSIYNYIIDEQVKALKEGTRKSLGSILIELTQKGIEVNRK